MHGPRAVSPESDALVLSSRAESALECDIPEAGAPPGDALAGLAVVVEAAGRRAELVGAFSYAAATPHFELRSPLSPAEFERRPSKGLSPRARSPAGSLLRTRAPDLAPDR